MGKTAREKSTWLFFVFRLPAIADICYNSIKEYYQMRRPETADSNILDLYIWLNCYPTWYFTNDKGLMWVAKSEDGQYYSSIPCCKDEDLKECFLETQKYFNEVLQKKLVMYVVDRAAVDLLQLPEDEYVVVPDRTYADLSLIHI